MKRKTLGWKIRKGVILFTVILTVLICLVISIVYRNNIVKRFRFEGQAFTGSIAASIDGNKALSYLKIGHGDDYYLNVLDGIRTSMQKFGLFSVSVAVPVEDGLQYIWRSDSGPEAIGQINPYKTGTESWIKTLMNEKNDDDTLRLVEDPEHGSLAVAANSVVTADGKIACIVFADFSAADITLEIVSVLWKIVLLIIVLRTVYMILFYHFFDRNIVEPIKMLTEASSNILIRLKRPEGYRNEIHTGDEIEQLSLSIERMDRELRRFLQDAETHAAEREKNKAELEMAASIQDNQLPKVFPESDTFDIYALMKPAKYVGGDFYDFFMIDHDRLAMVVADVSGKGIPASLFMMISRVMIKYCLKEGYSPAETLRMVNKQLMENNEIGEFVTVWTAVLDLSTGKGIAANAGHEHPALRDSEGWFSLIEYKHSPPVAISLNTRFSEHEFQLQPGDCLFVYSDGVPDAANPEKEFYGTDRMIRALNQTPNSSTSQAIEDVYMDIRAFVGDAEQFDDITMLCFHWKGQGEERENGNE